MYSVLGRFFVQRVKTERGRVRDLLLTGGDLLVDCENLFVYKDTGTLGKINTRLNLNVRIELIECFKRMGNFPLLILYPTLYKRDRFRFTHVKCVLPRRYSRRDDF